MGTKAQRHKVPSSWDRGDKDAGADMATRPSGVTGSSDL